MLKRIVYTDFGQFIAALKSAERLGLRYRVEREEISGTVKSVFGTDIPSTWVEYTLDLLPDATEESDKQVTA